MATAVSASTRHIVMDTMRRIDYGTTPSSVRTTSSLVNILSKSRCPVAPMPLKDYGSALFLGRLSRVVDMEIKSRKGPNA
jgi:hypothetical protein